LETIETDTGLRFTFGENTESMKDNLVDSELSINAKGYCELKVFRKKYKNHSKSKVRRRLKLLERNNFVLYVYRLMNNLLVSESLIKFELNSFKKTKEIKDNNLAYIIGLEWEFFGFVGYVNKLQQKIVKLRLERLGKKLASKNKENEIRLFHKME
jgi:hypothetical protein